MKETLLGASMHALAFQEPPRLATGCLICLLAMVGPIALCAQDMFQQPHLRLGPMESNGWRHVMGEHGSNAQVVTLMASSNLVDWETIAWLHRPEFDFIDPVAPQRPSRFYRLSSLPNPWRDANGAYHFAAPIKNQVDYPWDPFLGGDAGLDQSDRWIKFLIDLDRPARVFYSGDGSAFHHEFAARWLEPFLGISADEFERISMSNEGRRLLRGTVLYPFNVTGEYGIQFVGTDLLPPELIARYFELVRSTVAASPGLQAFYIPTYDQYPAAQAQRDLFTSNAIPIDTAERWAAGDLAYSTGWALGRLRYVPTTNIASAYASGELLPTDILITDGVPAELPYVAGVITLAPATANAHAAILARAYGVPFVYFIDAAERSRALQLTNQEVILQSVPVGGGQARTLLVELDPLISPEARAEILALRAAPPLHYTPTARYGAYWADTERLVPADIRYFGGKAANYGLRRRTIPTNSLPAVAISFDLWHVFLEQPLAGGVTLRQEISHRLAGFTFPPNVVAVQAALAAIRNLIRNATQFTPDQEAAVTNALSRFDRQRNIRFRSSTNVEIKQVREVPQITGTNVAPYLLNAPVTLVNFQGVYGGLWATHRLKSRWTLRTRTMSLTQSNLAAGMFTEVTVEHLNGTKVQTRTGPLSSFPNASRSRGGAHWSDRFILPTGDGPADFELRVYDLAAANSQCPFVKAVTPFIEGQYRNPTPNLHADYGDETPTVRVLTNASTWLRPLTTENARDTFREFTFNVPGQGTNVTLRTSFWLGSELVHGDRPPLLRFVETVIDGLTTEPIRLRGYWSQTFDAFHWQGNMLFLFEPRLEEGLPSSQHQELAAANIAAIYLNANGHQSYRAEQYAVTPGCSVMSLIALDGSIRRFSDCHFED